MARHKRNILPEYYDLIEEMASQGQTISQIAFELGMSKATLDRRIAENELLRASIDRGRMKSIQKVESVAYQMAVSGHNLKMTMFWLRHKAGWKN